MNNNPNLYWPIYKNLEKEVLNLANYIHFGDKQLKVYSSYIADLIVRCYIEIEAISKEMYKEITGNSKKANGKPLKFDTDCLALLEGKWKLSSKQITLSAMNMYFSNKMRVLTPLYKANQCGKSASDWARAYQALKHDRKNNLELGNIGNLIQSMGALYILNLYHKDETIDLDNGFFDNRAGSEIFSANYCTATNITISQIMSDNSIVSLSNDDLSKAVYIIKYDNDVFKKIHENFCRDMHDTEQNLRNSRDVLEFLYTHPNDGKELLFSTGEGWKVVKNNLCLRRTTQEIQKEKERKKIAILNKHEAIYPNLLPYDVKN